MTERTPVKSSFIKSVSHEGTTLIVEFGNGDLHKHDDVTAEEFAEFMKADSIGRFYGQYIRGAKPHTKLPAEKPADDDDGIPF